MVEDVRRAAHAYPDSTRVAVKIWNDVVFALGGSNDARWSGKKASTNPIDMHPLSRVAVNGMVLHGKMCKCIMKMISNSG